MQVVISVITLLALLTLNTRNAYAEFKSYDVREATIDGIHNALHNRITSCRNIVESFIARIEAYNPVVNAIITLNPNALSTADSLDKALEAGNVTGSLFCIPVLLKDNYDTVDMKTTGGCLDLADSQPTSDTPSVSAFKQAGAIILGKTNLHELALEGLSVSSLGGQTINPYDHTRTPGGSSGGTGAAIASSFAVLGTGTDTVNSLRNPASANSLFSIRPSRGLITRAGIIPVSYTQDVIGPFARNVKDLAVALTIMASKGFDPNDNVTALVPADSINLDYSAALHGGSLTGLRLGLIEGFFNRSASSETTPVNEALDALLSNLTRAGVTIVPIKSSIFNATAISSLYDVQVFEFRQEMNKYLSKASLKGTHPSTLSALYSSNKYLVIPSQHPFVQTSLLSSPTNTTYPPTKLATQNLTLSLLSTFKSHRLTALIYPQQKTLVVKIGSPSQSGRNGILAAVTGFPVVTVPAGFSNVTVDAPVGVPIGMEIMGLPWTERNLLNIARLIAERTKVRRPPAFSRGVVEGRPLDRVPVIKPRTSGIPAVYSIGVL